MAESYRRTEEKQGSLIDYGNRNNQDTTCGIYLHLPKERQCKEGCRSITVLKVHHRLDGEPERWLGM